MQFTKDDADRLEYLEELISCGADDMEDYFEARELRKKAKECGYIGND